jgi:cell division protein FtsZ
VDPDANIIFGSVIHDDISEEMKVTVIATGFEEREVHEIGSSRAAKRESTKIPEKMPLRPVLKEVGRGSGREAARSDEASWDIPTFLRKQAD